MRLAIIVLFLSGASAVAATDLAIVDVTVIDGTGGIGGTNIRHRTVDNSSAERIASVIENGRVIDRSALALPGNDRRKTGR